MRRGFTLIEVLTVIAIIGILATLGGYTYSAALTRSRDSQRISDLKLVGNSLEQFYLDNRTYPIYDGTRNLPQASWQLEDDLDCQTLSNRKYLAPKYLASIPQDPSTKLNLPANCTADPKGQYLYYSLPKDSGKNGYYLGARMEREKNVNHAQAVTSALTAAGYINLPVFCDRSGFVANPTSCSQNYFITNSRNQ